MNCGRGQFGVENIVEPSPFEIGGADGLGFVAGDEDGLFRIGSLGAMQHIDRVVEIRLE